MQAEGPDLHPVALYLPDPGPAPIGPLAMSEKALSLSEEQQPSWDVRLSKATRHYVTRVQIRMTSSWLLLLEEVRACPTGAS